MNKLKILSLVHNLFFGGDATRLLDFAKCVDRDRFEHFVMSIHHAVEGSSLNGNMRDRFAEAGVEVIDLGKTHGEFRSNSASPYHVFRSAKSLQRVVGQVTEFVKAHSIDVIDARLHTSMLVGGFASKRCGIPSVGTHYSLEKGDKKLIRRMVRQIAFGLTHTIVTDSDYWRDELRKVTLAPWTKFVNVPNGILSPQPVLPMSRVRQQLQIPDETGLQIVAQISRLVPYKGHRVLLDAARQVLEKAPNTFFLFVGHGAEEIYPAELKEQAERLGIADRVRIGGYQGPIGDVWQLIDVHAHASHLDSLPNAIIEGMSHGKPAVVTDVGGIPNLVTDEQTGLVVRTRDADALAGGILRMLENPADAQRFGAAARQRYEKRYTPPVMTRNLEQLFIKVCNGRVSSEQ